MSEKSETTTLGLAEPSSSAKVEGMITSLSPMKAGKTCKYFDGQIADDCCSVRFCGFNSTVRRRLEESYENGEPVLLDGCEIRKARQGDNFEVIVKNGTEILKSQKCFQVTKDKLVVSLAKVNELPEYQRIAVQAKVMHANEIMELRNGSKVQEVTIADATGHATLNVWEEHLGKIKEGCCFEMKGLMVRDFRGCKCLSTSKENCTIQEIDDIGTVSSNTDNIVQLDIKLIKNVRVFAVEKFESYRSCVKCSGKVSPVNEDAISECSKCATMQSTEECKQALIAQLRVKDENGERFCLTAFDSIVLKIAEEPIHAVSKKALIKADPFNMKFNNGVIYYVERC